MIAIFFILLVTITLATTAITNNMIRKIENNN